MALSAGEFEGKNVKSLKTLVAKQIGVPRFRQRWLSEDRRVLQDDEFVVASDVQLVVVNFVQAEEGEVQKLFEACQENNLDQVEKLLQKPLNPSLTREDEGELLTALHGAVDSEHVECLALLLEAGADTDLGNSEGMTALHLAAYRGQLEAVRMLLEAGAKADPRHFWGDRPLDFAAANGYPEVMRALLEAGADKDAVDAHGRTALHRAAMSGQFEAVRWLLDFGLDKDARDSVGQTALDVAVVIGHKGVIKLLQAAQADVVDKGP